MACPGKVETFVLTDHAEFEIARRGISREDVSSVLGAPEQALTVRPGRCVYQSRVPSRSTAGEVRLLRVFVDVDREVPEVVTAYRTSQVGKHWRLT
jgi:hypothetical protein